jgi:phage repressor protein C with HTH and peptisase S24 domain
MWASRAIGLLREGKQAVVKPHGGSMQPKVMSGATVILESQDNYQVDDVVLVRCKGNVYLHLIKATQGNRYQIGNNRGGINGWVGRAAIYGKAIKIDNDKH